MGTVTMMISLPTGTKIFNWLCTYLSTYLSLLQYQLCTIYYVIIFLLMFTIGGSTGIILSNACIDLVLHDTYYVVTHFHFVLSLGSVISLFCGLICYQDLIMSSQILSIAFSTVTSNLILYHLILVFVGILLTFTPMHFLGFNVMSRRIPDYVDTCNCWNYMCSIGSVLTVSSVISLII